MEEEVVEAVEKLKRAVREGDLLEAERWLVKAGQFMPASRLAEMESYLVMARITTGDEARRYLESLRDLAARL